MQRHDVDRIRRRRRVGVHDQGDMLEEAGHRLELLHRADQLLEVFEPPGRVGRAVGLPHLGVAGLLQNDLTELGVGQGVELVAPAGEGGQQVLE